MNSFKLARYRAGMSVKDAAEKADISQRTIARIENADHQPAAPIAKALADVYGCTIDELLGLQDEAA